ncbi:MAG: hypothetical protein M3O34_05280 [Chloroflexota bacterium]|nr:hypothetical protein [Chloroflexota bacterium]
MAVATDVGAWRVLEPVIAELRRRGRDACPMLAGKAAEYAGRAGVACLTLTGATLAEQAALVLDAEPRVLLLGTSVGEVVEWELARRARGRVPTVGVLDAMLFVERRFSDRLVALADVVACLDPESAERLFRAGARPEQAVVTGNPTLELIGATEADGGPPPRAPGEPVDVLFVSQPVTRIGRAASPFSIDERRSLEDVLAALADLRDLAPAGYRVRVRPHPIERLDHLPDGPVGVALERDDDPDRFRSARRVRVVVGLSSTLLAEARMLPRAAIAYLPGRYWDREPVYASEQGVRMARSVVDLRGMLAAAIRDAPVPAPFAAHAGAASRVIDLVLAAAR